VYGRGQRVWAWSLVAVQLLLLAGLVWTPGRRTWSTPDWLVGIAILVLAAASLIALAGAAELGQGLTASPLPSAAAQLRTTGVYACVRHPIYGGLLLGGAGVVLVSGRLTRVWVWLALLALLWLKVGLEERALAARFADYGAYAATTPRLVPSPVRCWGQLPARRA
jgi:protein-S-isoprenylcysteine O-methyltransferase Ste14